LTPTTDLPPSPQWLDALSNLSAALQGQALLVGVAARLLVDMGGFYSEGLRKWRDYGMINWIKANYYFAVPCLFLGTLSGERLL